MVEMSALSPNPEVRILVKLEGRNPGGSVKDRIALSMVEQAEKDGLLVPGEPGQVLIEPTSGNTGIGLAMVCRVKGYHLKVVLPTNVSVERRQLLEVWGAEIIESPGLGGFQRGGPHGPGPGRASTPSGSSCTSTPTRPTPRPTTRGPAPRSGGTAPRSPTSWPASGPRGPCSGWAGYLKERNPAVQVWAVEPPAGEMVDGLRNLDDGYIPPIFEELGGAELLDRKTVVRPKESIEWTRRLAEHGLFVGISTGAAMAGAVRCAEQVPEGERGGDRRGLGRRRLEVPLHRRLDRGPRRGGRAGQDDHLLLVPGTSGHGLPQR